MKAKEAIKEVMKSERYNYTLLGELIGQERRALWQKLNVGTHDLGCGAMCQILNAMGYKAVVVKKDCEVEGIELG